jgi:Prealbumin-like fold domain
MSVLRLGQRRWRRWWYAGVTLVAAAFFAAFSVVAASANVAGSPSNFESGDGNMVVTTAGNSDWNCFANGKGTGFANGINVGASGCTNLAYGNAFQAADPNAGTANDESWVSGQKMDLQCAKTTTGNNPAKDTFNNIAEYNETNSSHNLFLYGAAIRATANGNANENIELSQNPGTKTCPINRTAGDKLLQLNFNGNGTLAPPQILTYYTTLPTGVTCFSGASKPAPCWANPQSPSSGFEGGVDESGISGPNNGMTGNTLTALLFSEFGVNLSAVLGLPTNSCSTFGQETWESRSSSSFTSNPEDIEAFPHPISNCGSLLVKKTDGSGNLQSGAVFTASPGTTNTSGVTANTSTFVDESTVNSAFAGYYCLDNMLLGQTGTIHELSAPTGFNTAPDQSYTVTSSASCATRLAAATITPDNTFVDTPQLGALKIVKTAKNKNCISAGQPTLTNGTCTGAGVQALSGVSFAISQGGSQVGSSQTTDNNGVACFTNLALGGYTVTETAPTNYQGAAAHNVTITASSTPGSCSTGSPVVDPVSNTPLSKIEVLFNSSAGSGVTQATITCKDQSGATITPDSGSTTGSDQAYSGLVPNTNSGTYTCTVNIDP